MAIATKVTTTECILAIDLGKCKSVECRYEASSGEVAFASFETTSDELVKWLTRQQPDLGRHGDPRLGHSTRMIPTPPYGR